MKPETSSAMLTQSVTRALGILSCFTDSEPELRVIDFSKKLNLTQSNVSRLLATMVSIGYCVKDDLTGHYRLGPEIVTLGGIALNNYEIRKQALPELYEIERKTGIDANLAILDKGTIFYLAHVDSYDSPRMYTFNGRRNPLHSTAIGKALLAHLPQEEAHELLQAMPLGRFTEKTKVDIGEITSEWEQIRRQGYAIESEELALGRACIAVHVRDRMGKVAAGISISGPMSKMRLHERLPELSSLLIEMADRISMKMGHATQGSVRY